MGHIPRSMVVHCSGDTTRLCGPGDMVTISGIFLPTRYSVRFSAEEEMCSRSVDCVHKGRLPC